MTKKQREDCIKNGLCVCCGSKPTRTNRRTCERCGLLRTKSAIKCLTKKNLEGICVRCGRNEALDTRAKFRTCDECRRKGLKESKNYRDKIKYQCLKYYSFSGEPHCVCCGETIMFFLTLDHINGGGREERKLFNNTQIQRRAIKANFPEGYQTLCFNCNIGRYNNGGICPHKRNN